MTTTISCTIGSETYEIQVNLPDDAHILSIVRTSDYSKPELTPYASLGPFIQSCVDKRIRAYLAEQRRKDNLP